MDDIEWSGSDSEFPTDSQISRILQEQGIGVADTSKEVEAVPEPSPTSEVPREPEPSTSRGTVPRQPTTTKAIVTTSRRRKRVRMDSEWDVQPLTQVVPSRLDTAVQATVRMKRKRCQTEEPPVMVDAHTQTGDQEQRPSTSHRLTSEEREVLDLIAEDVRRAKEKKRKK